MELHPSVHLGVVAIEKGAIVSPSTGVTTFTYIWSSPCRIGAKVLDNSFKVREFELQ